MWGLYAAYRDVMQLEREFSPIQEAYAERPIAPPAPQAGLPPPVPNVATVTLGPIPAVFVESPDRTDVLEVTFEITLRRDWTGELNANVFATRSGWRTER